MFLIFLELVENSSVESSSGETDSLFLRRKFKFGSQQKLGTFVC
jgi:hypothetical protein